MKSNPLPTAPLPTAKRRLLLNSLILTLETLQWSHPPAGTLSSSWQCSRRCRGCWTRGQPSPPTCGAHGPLHCLQDMVMGRVTTWVIINDPGSL